ncbi:MAG: retropepsin-like domain-containing protein [Treponema sp.]|jgi:predicted aspartyl protease|nr:retropepsin-like domain-containing protein [Treponema sp.]
MSTFRERITLTNARDIGNARNGLIPETEVRAVAIDAMPDTGAWTLVINEETRRRLGLALEGSVTSTLADGSTARYGQTEAVKIQWQDRSTTQQALVVPDAHDVLLGALPLEAMDLMVDPVHERLTGVHGNQPVHVLYSLGSSPRLGVRTHLG